MSVMINLNAYKSLTGFRFAVFALLLAFISTVASVIQATKAFYPSEPPSHSQNLSAQSTKSFTHTMTVSQTSRPNTAPTSSVPTVPPIPQMAAGLSDSGKIAIGIAVPLGLVIMIIASSMIFVFRRRRERRRRQRSLTTFAQADRPKSPALSFTQSELRARSPVFSSMRSNMHPIKPVLSSTPSEGLSKSPSNVIDRTGHEFSGLRRELPERPSRFSGSLRELPVFSCELPGPHQSESSVQAWTTMQHPLIESESPATMVTDNLTPGEAV